MKQIGAFVLACRYACALGGCFGAAAARLFAPAPAAMILMIRASQAIPCSRKTARPMIARERADASASARARFIPKGPGNTTFSR